jgi:transcriptional antiterminator RfaH
MKHWYAVYTQPRNESLASAHLARQGFDVFCPRYLKRRSHARRIEKVPAALFPRYMFVAFDAMAAGWRAIRSTRGVIDLVRIGDDPAVVPDTVIDNIKARQDDDGYIALARQVRFEPGDRIRIDGGAFASCEAIFQAQRDDDRIVALVALLGRKVVVQVPIDMVGVAS